MRRYRNEDVDGGTCLILSGFVLLVFTLAGLCYLALGWLAQQVYLAFAGPDWARPDYWAFVGLVVLVSVVLGGVYRSRGSS